MGTGELLSQQEETPASFGFHEKQFLSVGVVNWVLKSSLIPDIHWTHSYPKLAVHILSAGFVSCC